MGTKQVNLRLPGWLLEQLDVVRGGVPRERWIRDLIVERLGTREELESVNAMVGEAAQRAVGVFQKPSPPDAARSPVPAPEKPAERPVRAPRVQPRPIVQKRS